MTVAVVGARRRRQGTGHYLARAFAARGCELRAVAGSSAATAAEAAAALRAYAVAPDGAHANIAPDGAHANVAPSGAHASIAPDGAHANIAPHSARTDTAPHGAHADSAPHSAPRAYTDIARMLRAEAPAVLVVATPAALHSRHVALGLAANCHVFCEKPLFCPVAEPDAPAAAEARARALCDDFAARGRALRLNTQWPFTLAACERLHPALRQDRARGAIARFEMRLCPESTGLAMLSDALPHPLSMLHALVGAGRVAACVARFSSDARRLDLAFDYLHARGRVRALVLLEQRLGQPKPAAYDINGRRVARRVDMAQGYRLSLRADDGRETPLADPLAQSVDAFVATINAGGTANDAARRDDEADAIVAGARQLFELARAVRAQNPGIQ